MSEEDEEPWFEPKRYGYGSGLPIAWQGWALIAGLLAIVLGAVPLAEKSPFGYIVVAATATIAFLIICARKTRGGWRWRRGERE